MLATRLVSTKRIGSRANLPVLFFVDEFEAPDIEKCLAFGHIESIHGVNASEGCCDCWYGYDADTGGGYQGILLGKMLRIGMMNYTDLEYVHNVTRSGDVEEDSTIYEFVRNASESCGFGLIHYTINELNMPSVDDTYYACLNGEFVNFLQSFCCVFKIMIS